MLQCCNASPAADSRTNIRNYHTGIDPKIGSNINSDCRQSRTKSNFVQTTEKLEEKIQNEEERKEGIMGELNCVTFCHCIGCILWGDVLNYICIVLQRTRMKIIIPSPSAWKSRASGIVPTPCYKHTVQNEMSWNELEKAKGAIALDPVFIRCNMAGKKSAAVAEHNQYLIIIFWQRLRMNSQLYSVPPPPAHTQSSTIRPFSIWNPVRIKFLTSIWVFCALLFCVRAPSAVSGLSQADKLMLVLEPPLSHFV